MYLISICNFLALETHVLVNDWIVQMHTILTSVFAWVYSMGNKISFSFLELSNLRNPIGKEIQNLHWGWSQKVTLILPNRDLFMHVQIYLLQLRMLLPVEDMFSVYCMQKVWSIH